MKHRLEAVFGNEFIHLSSRKHYTIQFHQLNNIYDLEIKLMEIIKNVWNATQDKDSSAATHLMSAYNTNEFLHKYVHLNLSGHIQIGFNASQRGGLFDQHNQTEEKPKRLSLDEELTRYILDIDSIPWSDAFNLYQGLIHNAAPLCQESDCFLKVTMPQIKDEIPNHPVDPDGKAEQLYQQLKTTVLHHLSYFQSQVHYGGSSVWFRNKRKRQTNPIYTTQLT
jgi:hypothetical protein